MHRTAELFEKPHVPRRVLMHVYDVCTANCEGEKGEPVGVRMQCARCSHMTDWIDLTVTEAKRGIPCPRCSSYREIPR